jgi:hypothetical protein
VYAFSAANRKSTPDQVQGRLSPENAMTSMEGLLAIYAFEYDRDAARSSQLQPGTEVLLKRTQRTRATPVRGHQYCGFSGSLGSGAFGRDERNYS